MFIIQPDKRFNKKQIANAGSVLYNFTWAISEFIGPVLGGYLTDVFGFARNASLIGITNVSYCLLFLIVMTCGLRRPEEIKPPPVPESTQIESDSLLSNTSTEK